MAVTGEPLRLEAFAVIADPQPLVPAPPGREWYDKTRDRHIYKCLPVAVGNCYGWQVLCPADIAVAWNGGERIEDLAVRCERPNAATSNFAHGICTFDVGWLFRTPPGVHLMYTGPLNHVKDGATPITGVVETDWLPYTATMNWRLSRPGVVTWAKGEPYCQIIPVKAGLLDQTELVLHDLADDSALQAEHVEWRRQRTEHRAKMAAGDAEALRVPWLKLATRGRYATDGRSAEGHHVTKLRLASPRDERGLPVRRGAPLSPPAGVPAAEDGAPAT